MANKKKTSFTLSDEGIRLLTATSQKLGISMAGVLELAIREKATKEKVD